jgi:hypothetical protein
MLTSIKMAVAPSPGRTSVKIESARSSQDLPVDWDSVLMVAGIGKSPLWVSAT